MTLQKSQFSFFLIIRFWCENRNCFDFNKILDFGAKIVTFTYLVI